MPSRTITDRLSAGERLLLDGGTGSELQRRGVDVLKGASPSDLGPWSGTANLDAPDVVRQVHSDYLSVGADIITSNSFWTSPSRLARAGLGERWERYASAAGRLAVEARDAIKPEAYVAAGMAPPTMQGVFGKPESDVEILGEKTVHDEFAQHARVLADAGADVMLPEYVGHISDCATAVDACATTGRPVFLGVRHVTAEGTMQYGESIEDLCEALAGHEIAAVLLMCSKPEDVSATLPRLREAFGGPVGAYPNIGYQPLAPLRGGSEAETCGTDYSPAQLADFAGAWVEMGASIIGGCCSTRPDHIAAMRPLVKG